MTTKVEKGSESAIPSAEMPHPPSSLTTFRILLISLLALFSLQLLTFWIENLFRLSLTKLSMGNEMYGVFLLMIPLLFKVWPRPLERLALALAMGTLLLTRLACPYLDPAGIVVVAGIGVASSVILTCFALSGSAYSIRAPHFIQGLGLAVLLSITLRAWGSSYDISTGGPGIPLGWGLVLLALALCFKWHPESWEDFSWTEKPSLGTLALGIGLFGNLAMIYWFLASPAVVSCWSGSNYFVNLSILCGVWILTPGPLAKPLLSPTRGFLILWNLSFSGSLVGGLLLNSVAFPVSSTTPPLVVLPAPLSHQIPFYLALFLSPVVLANLNVLVSHARRRDPRSQVLPVLLGVWLLVGATTFLIFTNTWGYVGSIGPYLRGKFYLPFLVAAIAMVLPLIRKPRTPERDPVRSPKLGLATGFLGVLALLGAGWQSANPQPAPSSNELTLLTYNLQLGSAENGKRNYYRQLDLLRSISPDIIGLQESDTARPSGGNVDVVRFFADQLNYYSYLGPSTIAGTYGTAILSRFPLKNTRTLFSYSTADEIATAVAEVYVEGTTFTLINNHPAGHAKAKQAHVETVLSLIAKTPRVIAMGDFNFRQGSTYYDQLAAALQDSWLSRHPFAKGAPPSRFYTVQTEEAELLDMTERIDHIFLSQEFQVKESYYLPVPESESDHPAHWSVITWEKTPAEHSG